jgi:rfaE bifunctional protein kinase chain/domain
MTRLPPIARDRGHRIASGFAGLRILVIGDAMIDRFIIGDVARISPEAPVPVVTFRRDILRLGGAANVAHNVVALGGHATLVAVAGRDDAADALTRTCRQADIAPALVTDTGRPTTTKMRIVTERNQQVARVDYEVDDEVAGSVEEAIVAAIEQHAPRASAVILSDYHKGCITRRTMAATLAAAAAHDVPVLVDPKIPHLDYYAGATVVTPNHHEAELATHMRVRSVEEARRAARIFRERVRCDAVLMTRGDQGMWLLGSTVEGYLPAAAREVADVTGAGDTVIATLALAVASGAALAEAAWLANEAAGISVSRFGPAIVTPAELFRAIDTQALS